MLEMNSNYQPKHTQKSQKPHKQIKKIKIQNLRPTHFYKQHRKK